MAVVTDKPKSKFWEECGNGFDSRFNSCDGDTGVGYRMVHRQNGASESLDVCLCHFYYGK